MSVTVAHSSSSSSSSSSVQRNLIASTASIAAVEDPSSSRLLSGSADDAAGGGGGGADLFRVLPQWQRVELCIVELMQHSMEMQLQQATKTRTHREAKRREAEAAAAEIRPIVSAANKLEKYTPATNAAAASSSSAKTVKRPPNTAAVAAAAASSSSASAAVAAADSSASPSPSAASDSSAAAESEADSPFLAHFHLLSHLLLELNAPTLERLISFLDPSPAPATAAATAAAAPAAATTGSASGGPASGMALCFRLLDPSTQVSLVELLLKCVLQWKEILDTAERRQHDEMEAAHRRRARSEQQDEEQEEEERKHEQHAEGEIAPGEGKPASAAPVPIAAAAVSSRPAAAAAAVSSSSRTPTPAVLAQQRLLQLLRWYSGLYRLSHILPRCLDYQNWLAAAVAIESRPAASVFEAMPMQGSLPPPAPRIAPVLLAAGALDDVNHTHLVDALECRLKHMEMRAESWRRWKRARRAHGASLDAMDRPSCPSSLHDVPLLVDGLLPPLPADVWLSFDEYAVDTGKMLLQLVVTHLVHIAAVSEQARLTALLMRAWREWDLPSLLLESIFLSNLLALAGGLCMLAFQKQRPASMQQQANAQHQSILSPPPSHNFSTDGSVVPASAARGDAAASSSSSAAPSSSGGGAAAASAAPIFSAKLYLALTHYRLNAVYRANQSSGVHGSSVSSSVGVGGGGLSGLPSSSSASSAPPSLAQSHRLWSEILANLHRDLDGGAQNNTYMIIRGVAMPPPILINSAAASSSSSSAAERLSLSADFAPSVDSSSSSNSSSSSSGSLLLVSFSCGHVFPLGLFGSQTLPHFAQALQSLSPPIPITGKFIMDEYHRLISYSSNSGGGGGGVAGTSSNGASSSAASSSGGGASSAGASDTPGKCVAALSCPSCVFSALVSMHRKSESIRGATSAALVARQTSQALQASMASRAHLAHLEALGGGEAMDSRDGGSAVAAGASIAAPGLPKSASSLGQSMHAPPSRSLTPNPLPAPSPRSSDGTAGIRLGPGHRTTLSMMAASASSASASSSSSATPVSPPGSAHAQPHPAPAPAGRHKFGLSMSGMIPKVMTFGRVSLADLESS